MCDQDFREGSPLHEGDEEDEPHQVTHGTTVSDCRICKWIGGQGRKWLDKSGNPYVEQSNLFVNHQNKSFQGCPKFVKMAI